MGRRKKPRLVKDVAFTGFADKGKSVGRDEEGRVIFVEEVVPGDVADVLVLRKRKGTFQGVAQQISTYSPDRVDPVCEHFGVCGGCKWQHLSYEAQLRHKQKVVEDAMRRIGKIDTTCLEPIVGGASTTYYRNKLEFAFSNRRWLTKEEIDTDISNQADVLGFHRAGAFDKVVDIQHCWLQGEPSNQIRNRIREMAHARGDSFYDLKANTGFLRHLLIRVTSIGEVLVILSFGEDNPKKIEAFLAEVLVEFPSITTLTYCVNTKLNDYIFDLDMICFHGKGYIEEQLGHVRFKIGPKSFFQTNTQQAKVLYDTVIEFADLQGTENVYDLYTGIGSIALYVAQQCGQVVGIEEISAAIVDAEENASLNKIDNAIFYAGDVKDILTTEFAEKHGKPDLLITDPPRAGMHPKVVEMLKELAAPRIVYVSCNPATQARDLQLLESSYTVRKIRPVDMFPHTHHIESVALLELK
ncbi:MAG: 23S rRNA (uracil(1939)-C(5))-methyltransferase RlmD [Saprospiraceae bacterium]|nr:23S rRNA (uracil(1939)-C(5))-methyltransferase RlmD [Saprospiraceae bacterium]